MVSLFKSYAILLILHILISHIKAACTSTQWDDNGTCKDCSPPCKTCTSVAKCSTCAHPSMIYDSAAKSCSYCPDGKYYDNSSGTPKCTACPTGCTKCLNATACLECSSDNEFMDTLTLKCGASCTKVPIQTGKKRYCRDTNIYINSGTTKSVELGTIDFPYKTIDKAFIEVYNYWSNRNVQVNILTMAGTNNTVLFATRPLVTIGRSNVKLSTYTTTTPAPKTIPRATLHFTNLPTYTPDKLIRWSLIGPNVGYDFNLHQDLKSSEKGHITSAFYCIIPIRSGFTIDNFLITNKLKLDFDDFTVLAPINLGAQYLKVYNIEFKMYGTAMISFTMLSFHADNTIFHMENLVGGYVFLISCNPLVDVTTGDVMINKLTLDGPRKVLLKYGGVYMTGPQNFTVQNSHFGSHAFMFDAKQLIRSDSPLNCLPFDNVQQRVAVINNVFQHAHTFTGTPTHGYICSQNSWYPRHNLIIDFSGNHINDVYLTFERILQIEAHWADIIVNHNIWKNSSSSFDVNKVESIKSFTFNNNTFQNISSTSQHLMSMHGFKKVTIHDFKQLGAYAGVVSNTILNFDIAQDGTIDMDRILFKGNIFPGTKALVQGGRVSMFKLQNSIFQDDKLLKNTDYIDINSAKQFLISNVNFTNMNFLNPGDSNIYLLLINNLHSMKGIGDSFIKDIRFDQITTNAVRFGGMVDGEKDADSNLYIDSMVVVNSVFSTPGSLFRTMEYKYQGVSKLYIRNSQFTTITYQKNGQVLDLSHNSKADFILQNVLFRDIYGGGIKLSPADLFDLSTPLNIKINQCTILNNVPFVTGFIHVFKNTKLVVETSSFENNFSVESGSVIIADYKENIVDISNSTFKKNYAILGGVFYSQFQSVISCTNCTFQDNIAIIGGIAFLDNNGRLNLQNSTITQNLALSAPFIYLTGSNNDFSTFSKVNIEQNFIITMETLLKKSNPKLAHIDARFLNVVRLKRDFYLLSISKTVPSTITMIQGKLKIIDSSSIFNQTNLIATYESQIELDQTTINLIQLPKSNIVFHLVNTQLTINNSRFLNIECPTRDNTVIQIRMHSKLTLNNMTTLNNTCQLLYTYDTKVKIDKSDFKSTQSNLNFIMAIQSDLEMKNTNLSGLATTKENLIEVKNSQKYLLQNSRFINCEKTFFFIRDSHGDVKGSTFMNDQNRVKRAIHTLNGRLGIMNSSFYKFKHTQDGGAVYANNCNMTVDKSSFIENNATNGGAIYLGCDTTRTCGFSVTNTNFISNFAAKEGGGVKFNYFQPQLSGNQYRDNRAVYGADVAGYPYKILQQSSLQKDYVSGQKIETPLVFKLVDSFGKVIASNNESVLTLNPKQETEAKVIGNSDKSVINGIASFNDIKLIAAPNAQKVEFDITTNSINTAKIVKAFNVTGSNVINFKINFRGCLKGEQQTDKECIRCPQGKYSLLPGQKECLTCPESADCLGNDTLIVHGGYWRSNFETDEIFPCLYEKACLKMSQNDTKQSYKCKEGYSGRLCHKCIEHNGNQYQRASSHECRQCISPVLNSIRLIFVCFAITIFFCCVFYFSVKSNKNPIQGLLLRTLTNYIQIVTSAFGFNLSFPMSVATFLSGVAAIGDGAKMFLSIDCFIQDFGMVKSASTPIFFKALMMFLSPIIFCLFTTLGVLLLKLVFRLQWKTAKQYFVIFNLIILYNLYPQILGSAAGLFNCVKVEEDTFYLYKNVNIKCWSSTHALYAIFIGVPMLLIWTLGLPLCGYLYLRYYQRRLKKPEFQFMFGILYAGYRHETFYWEFVNTFRKVALVLINTFMSIYHPIYKAFVATLTLAIVTRYQEISEPYEVHIMNEMEFRESTTSIVTLFGGMFFITANLPTFMRILLIILIFLVNIWFFSMWLHLFFKSSRFTIIKVMALFLGRFSCLGMDYWAMVKEEQVRKNQPVNFLFQNDKTASMFGDSKNINKSIKEVEEKSLSMDVSHVLDDSQANLKFNTNTKKSPAPSDQSYVDGSFDLKQRSKKGGKKGEKKANPLVENVLKSNKSTRKSKKRRKSKKETKSKKKRPSKTQSLDEPGPGPASEAPEMLNSAHQLNQSENQDLQNVLNEMELGKKED